jgi:hypothetical protein
MPHVEQGRTNSGPGGSRIVGGGQGLIFLNTPSGRECLRHDDQNRGINLSESMSLNYQKNRALRTVPNAVEIAVMSRDTIF